jgi:hypothetical protein
MGYAAGFEVRLLRIPPVTPRRTAQFDKRSQRVTLPYLPNAIYERSGESSAAGDPLFSHHRIRSFDQPDAHKTDFSPNLAQISLSGHSGMKSRHQPQFQAKGRLT